MVVPPLGVSRNLVIKLTNLHTFVMVVHQEKIVEEKNIITMLMTLKFYMILENPILEKELI